MAEKGFVSNCAFSSPLRTSQVDMNGVIFANGLHVYIVWIKAAEWRADEWL
jgi:hypothetical protein